MSVRKIEDAVGSFVEFWFCAAFFAPMMMFPILVGAASLISKIFDLKDPNLWYVYIFAVFAQAIYFSDKERKADKARAEEEEKFNQRLREGNTQ